jgi:hypothetical protein
VHAHDFSSKTTLLKLKPTLVIENPCNTVKLAVPACKNNENQITVGDKIF